MRSLVSWRTRPPVAKPANARADARRALAKIRVRPPRHVGTLISTIGAQDLHHRRRDGRLSAGGRKAVLARLDASEHHKSDIAGCWPSLSTLHRTGCRSSSPWCMHASPGDAAAPRQSCPMPLPLPPSHVSLTRPLPVSLAAPSMWGMEGRPRPSAPPSGHSTRLGRSPSAPSPLRGISSSTAPSG